MKFVVWKAYYLESREIADNYISRVKDMLTGHQVVVCEDLESIVREITDADVMLGWRITPEVFAQARNLKWIQFGSSGIDHSMFPELEHSKVILTTMSGIHTVPVAEHTIALMLALSRRLDIAAKLQAEHTYDRSEIAATSGELAGKTIGIVGLGKIGLSIARLAKAFGMRVVGTKRRVDSELEWVDEVYPSTDSDKILPISDFLVLVVPLTGETRHLIDSSEIAMMKDRAYLINVARGAMVDHNALREALTSGKLRGAALDVFPIEPLAPDSKYYNMPNVIITPHTAGSSNQYSERAAGIFSTNLTAFLGGGEMINVYDREKGY